MCHWSLLQNVPTVPIKEPLIVRAPKRSNKSSTVSTPVKKAKQEEIEETEFDEHLSFKSADWTSTKGEQKRKKWKNLKQILDLPSSASGPEGLEGFTCISHNIRLIFTL